MVAENHQVSQNRVIGILALRITPMFRIESAEKLEANDFFSIED